LDCGERYGVHLKTTGRMVGPKVLGGDGGGESLAQLGKKERLLHCFSRSIERINRGKKETGKGKATAMQGGRNKENGGKVQTFPNEGRYRGEVLRLAQLKGKGGGGNIQQIKSGESWKGKEPRNRQSSFKRKKEQSSRDVSQPTEKRKGRGRIVACAGKVHEEVRKETNRRILKRKADNGV